MSLVNILKSFKKGFLKDVLTGAGLTLATSGTVLIVFNQMVGQFRSSLGSVSTDILSLAHIAGFDVFFSLVLGAYVTKFTLSAGTMSVKKLGK